MKKIGKLFLLLLLFGLLGQPGLMSPAIAQDDDQDEFVERPASEDLLPETTVLYAQLANVRDMVEKMQRSSGGKLMQNEKIANLTGEMMSQVRDMYSEVEDQVGLSIDEIASLPAGEIVIAMIAPKRKRPVPLIMIEVGTKNEAVDKALDRGRDLLAEQGEDIEVEEGEEVVFETVGSGDERFTFFKKDGLLVGCSDRTELDNLLIRWAGGEVEKIRPLSKNRKFITIMNRCRGTQESPPELRFYIDPIELARSANRGSAGAQMAINMLPILGLDGFLAAGFSSIMEVEEFESVFHGHVLLANPRKGILEIVAMKPGDYRPESWVPSNVTNYMTTSWDVPKMYSEIGQIVDTFMGEDAFENQVQENINDEIGIDFYEDFIKTLSGRITYTQWVVPPARVNSNVNVIAFGLRDKDKFLETMDIFMERIQEENEDEVILQTREYKGVTIWSQPDEQIDRQQERLRERMEERGQPMVELRSDQPCFAIVNDDFVFSTDLKFLEVAIDTDRGDLEPLRTEARYAAVSKKIARILKTDTPSAIFYSQPEDVMRMLFEVAASDDVNSFLDRQSEENEYLARFKRTVDENPLPDFEEVKQFFQPSGAFITSDETGYHMFGFQMRTEEEAEEAKK